MNIDFDRVSKMLESEGNLVSPSDPDRVVFVGDTHGDLEASKTVFDRYFTPGTVLTFLGDYVDRGPKSEKNINFLLQQKLDYPERVILLQGNHEGLKYRKFGPVNFWNSLSPGNKEKYRELLATLPLIFSWRNLVATHGGLPDVGDLHEAKQIERGDSNWEKITWGDFNEVEGYILGGGFGRPQLGIDYFEQAMESLEKGVLIRSHQPNVPIYMFGDRCVTIFTSAAYGTRRRVAVAEEPVNSGQDLVIKEL